LARTVEVTAPGPEAELAADALWRAGAVAIEERAGAGGRSVLVAATAADDPGPLLAAVAGRWPARVASVDLDAALDAWREHARPVLVGDQLVVRPPWVAAPGPARDRDVGRVEVVIDPGRAFGSGAHPSTRLALAALAEQIQGGEAVLDVGCGSGVLALAALALGAVHATAVDVDPAALAATAANGDRNGLAGRLTVGDRVAGRHDLAVANLLLPDLVGVASEVAAALAPGGTLVLAGILAEQGPAAVAAYSDLVPVAQDALDGWLAVTLRAR
jgi:ribosomal protein L11 methyltransferase